MTMNIIIKKLKDNLHVIEINGKFNIESVSDFEEKMDSFFNEIDGTVLLNLSGMVYIDSSGVGAIIKYINKSKISNVKVIIYNLRESIRNIFQRTYLDKFFTIKTIEELKLMYPDIDI